jgi:hypothetical protein
MKLKRSDWIALAMVALLAAGVWYLRTGRGGVYAHLIDQFGSAEKRSVLAQDEAFRLVEPEVAGVKRRAIYMHPTSRLIFHQFNVPRHAWLRVYLALSPEVWDRPGDGVVFRFGIRDDRGAYEELLKQVVNPAGIPDDRRWLPVDIDLTQYAGEKLSLVFNTNSSLAGDDAQNDWALWGDPHIVIRP